MRFTYVNMKSRKISLQHQISKQTIYIEKGEGLTTIIVIQSRETLTFQLLGLWNSEPIYDIVFIAALAEIVGMLIHFISLLLSNDIEKVFLFEINNVIYARKTFTENQF